MAETEDKKVLTKADIVDALQAGIGFPRRITTEVLEDMLEIIKTSLEKGESVRISGFGNFEVQEKKARRGRNPRSGEEITISARNVVSFKPSQVLRKALNDDTS